MIINKKTKIVATLGPATNTKETLTELASSGVNVFRINFSHAEHAEVKKRIKIIRELGEKLGSNTSILADLQGPKLRVGTFAKGSEELVEGAKFRMDLALGPFHNLKTVP